MLDTIGNIMWYCGHCTGALSTVPSLISRNGEYTLLITFSVAAFGQLITMLSRYIERLHCMPKKSRCYKAGNIMWYIGHSLSMLSILPLLSKGIPTSVPFSVAALGQLIIMLSRLIERFNGEPNDTTCKKVGNIMWYSGHCIGILGISSPLIRGINGYTVLVSFSIAAFGQMITMISRLVERYGLNTDKEVSKNISRNYNDINIDTDIDTDIDSALDESAEYEDVIIMHVKDSI
jgi:hypothetical protein